MGFTRSDLKDLDKVWKDALTGGAATESEVPEGKYQAKVKEVELGKSSGGRPQCKFVYKITGGAVAEAVGKELTTYDGLESTQNMGFFFKKLKRLQLRMPESFEDIEEVVEKAVGATVDIQVKVKDDFTNVYVNKLVKAAAGAAKAEDDEDEPKKDEDDEEVKPKKGAKAAAEDDDEDAPAKPAKKPAEDDEEDEKPKAEADDEDEDKPKKGEEEEEEEEKAAAPARNFPTLAEVDKMPEKGLRKLLKQFKAEPAEGKKESLLKSAAKVLVSVMEDDDYEAEEGDLRVTAKWLGLAPEEGKKKLLRQIVKHLGG